MDSLKTLDYSLQELRKVVATLDESQMAAPSNCEPWTVRQLASHAVNNQLFWAGLVTGQQLVAFEDSMSAVPIEGALAPVADDVAARGDGDVEHRRRARFDSRNATRRRARFGGHHVCHHRRRGSRVDLSASVGRPIEFESQTIPSITVVVAATCTDGAETTG